MKKLISYGLVGVSLMAQSAIASKNNGDQPSRKSSVESTPRLGSDPKCETSVLGALFGSIAGLSGVRERANRPWSDSPFKAPSESEIKRQRERDAREKLELEKMKKSLVEMAKKKDIKGRFIADAIVADTLLAQIKEAGFSVSILIGNKAEVFSENDFAKIARSVSKKQGLVVVDADSAPSLTVLKEAGPFGIGITGNPDNEDPANNIFYVANPYLRLKILSATDRTITSPGSTTGMAVWVEEGVHYVVSDTEKIEKRYKSATMAMPGFLGWSSHFAVDTKRITRLSAFTEKIGESNWRPASPVTVDLKASIGAMTRFAINNLIEDATVYVNGLAQMEKSKIPAGAVVFGSGKGDDRWDNLVYQVSRKLSTLGIPVTTGGAGGFMEVANKGAYSGGSDSIGIPMTGARMLSTEMEIGHSSQTLTIAASGYENRIPMLLHNRPLIIFVPGGSGTAKELAVALVELNANPNPNRLLVFVAGDYYSELAELIGSFVSPEIAKTIKIVKSVDEVEPLIKKLELQAGFDSSVLRTQVPPQPRNDVLKIEKPKYEYRYEKRSWGSGPDPKDHFKPKDEGKGSKDKKDDKDKKDKKDDKSEPNDDDLWSAYGYD